jgi:hypothetical protein
MEQNVSFDNSNYQFIVENTILEVNKVLHNWKINDKKDDYNDRLSLFRTYFSKFFKQKYGWIMYNEYIRKNYPVCTVYNHKLINIDLNLDNYQLLRSKLSKDLNDYIKSYDFIKFNDLHPIIDETLKVKDFTEIKNLNNVVDYKKIEQITF